jgi:hypothetical protein
MSALDASSRALPPWAAVRYHAALLGRSQRWLPPALLYGAALAIDSGSGDYLGDSFGYSAALLLPAVAWLTGAMLAAEPPETYDITASVLGPARARLSALLAAVGYGLLLAALGAAAAFADGGSPPPDGAAAARGTALTAVQALAAELLCVLLGTAVAALAAPPLLPGLGWSVLVTGALAIGVLVAPFSPANAVIRSLDASSGGAHTSLLLACPLALALTAAAWYAACHAATRR